MKRYVWMAIALMLAACPTEVTFTSDGDLQCKAPEYDVQALDCNFDMRCNTLDALDIAESDWACECWIRPKRKPDLNLACTLTSSTTEVL